MCIFVVIHSLKCLLIHKTDGEVESFKLIPATLIANVIRTTKFFKPNCSVVIIDFLFRHGYENVSLF